MEKAKRDCGSKQGHYLFFDLISDPETGFVERRKVERGRQTPAQFIQSWYENPFSRQPGMQRMVFFLGVDIDVSSTSSTYLDPQGRVCHKKLLHFMETMAPDIFTHVTAVARSRGGRGLHVIFRVSPFPLVTATNEDSASCYLGVNQLATSVQKKLVEFFNLFGFGADPCAIGPRLWSNWVDGPCLYKRDESVESALRHERRSVLSEIARSLQDLAPELRRRRLYNDERVEGGLARLFVHLLDAAALSCPWPRQDSALGLLSGSEVVSRAEMSLEELRTLTGCSKSFLSRLLREECASEAPWVQGAYDARNRVWVLELLADDPVLFHAWAERARSCVRRQQASLFAGRGEISPMTLCPPHEVQDGHRNNWIWRFCALHKLLGFTQQEAGERLNCCLELIPGHESSRSVKHASRVLRSVFSCQKQTTGVWEKRAPELPEWFTALGDYLRQNRSQSEQSQGNKILSFYQIQTDSSFQVIEALRAQGSGVLVHSRSGFFPFRVFFDDGKTLGVRFSDACEHSELCAGDHLSFSGVIREAIFENRVGRKIIYRYLEISSFEVKGFDLKAALNAVRGLGRRLVRKLSALGHTFFEKLKKDGLSGIPGLGPRKRESLVERFLNSGLYLNRFSPGVLVCS